MSELEKIFLLVLPLLIGACLDKFFADPHFSFHPVRVMGKWISFFTRKLNHGSHKTRLWRGGLLTFFLVLMSFYFFWLMERIFRISEYYNLLLFVWRSLFVFLFLAAEGLIREGKNVLAELEKNISCGRNAVARIVGRDTQNLDQQGVYRALLETLSENLSDGVTAPLFFYALGGVPAMAAYKMINTLDSMIAYKNKDFLYFGRVAAYADDAANFLPARLTAFSLLLLSRNLRKIKTVCNYAGKHESPNAGYPEAALAEILNLRLGGTAVYFGEKKYKAWLGVNPREIKKDDVEKTFFYNQLVLTFLLLLLVVYFIFK